jgi:hypothetical protein
MQDYSDCNAAIDDLASYASSSSHDLENIVHQESRHFSRDHSAILE